MSIRRLAGETVLYGGSTILNRLLNFIIVTPYLTRVFAGEKGEYGIHGLMYAFAALLMVLLTYGMETAFFRFANRPEHRGAAFSTAAISLIGSTVAFVALLLLFAPEIAGLLTRPEDARYVVYFACIIGFDVLCAIPFARLRLENRPLRFALVKAANILINGLAIIFLLEGLPGLARQGVGVAETLYHPGWKLDYVFIANLLASAATLLMLAPLYRSLRLGAFDRNLWRQMLAYAAPLVVVGVAGMINQLSDRYLLKQWLPGTLDENLIQLGIYNACVKIAVLMNLFTQAFKYAAEPFFFQQAAASGATEKYARVGQAFTLVGSLTFLGIMLYLDLVRYLIDPSFWEGLHIVPLLLLAYLFLGLYFNFSFWYKLTDRTRFGAYIATGGAVITLALNYLLIPHIGYLGSAWAALGSFSAMAVVCLAIGRRYYPVPYPLGRMGLYLLLALALWGISLVLPSQAWDLGPKMAVHTLLLGVFLLGIFVMERAEIRQWLALRRKGG